jgi:hypothetical protein
MKYSCETCANMRVFDDGLMRCCANPPVCGSDGLGQFPVVAPSWWCRRYENKENFKR